MSKYVVVDLEMCRIPKSKKALYPFSQEIIEIGAVLLDEAFDEVGSFKTYVSPQFGRIDKYINRLTGITNDETRTAPVAKDAVEQFLAWVPEDAVIVAWSDSDAFQLRTETELKGCLTQRLEMLLDASVDCQLAFAERIDSPKSYNLTDALIIAAVDYEDGAHDALIDARNTALLYSKMMKNPSMKLNPYYTYEKPRVSTCNPFADLLTELKCAV